MLSILGFVWSGNANNKQVTRINISHLLLVLCAVRDFIHELKSMNCAFENPKYSMICISLAHQIHIMS